MHRLHELTLKNLRVFLFSFGFFVLSGLILFLDFYGSKDPNILISLLMIPVLLALLVASLVSIIVLFLSIFPTMAFTACLLITGSLYLMCLLFKNNTLFRYIYWDTYIRIRHIIIKYRNLLWRDFFKHNSITYNV